MTTASLGQKIRTLRLKAQMSQEVLAAYMGIAQQTVNAYENEDAVPPMKRLVQLSLILKADPDYFYPTYTKQTEGAEPHV